MINMTRPLLPSVKRPLRRIERSMAHVPSLRDDLRNGRNMVLYKATEEGGF
jgi:hypothetical protein